MLFVVARPPRPLWLCWAWPLFDKRSKKNLNLPIYLFLGNLAINVDKCSDCFSSLVPLTLLIGHCITVFPNFSLASFLTLTVMHSSAPELTNSNTSQTQMQILSPNPSLTLTSAIFAVGHPSAPEPADPAEFRNHHVSGQALQQLLRLLHGRRIQGEI